MNKNNNRNNNKNKYKERTKSSIYNIRLFHNMVKRELLTQTVDFLKENYKLHTITLLDLSCGKGGDLQKWYDNGINNVIGFDIDESSIIEANRRYKSLIDKLQKKGVKSFPDYKFYVMDLSKEENFVKISHILKDNKFNIVSCQFALHYFFETENILNTFLTIVREYIKLDGFFITTTMNGKLMKESFLKGESIQNEIFKIESKVPINELDNKFGNKYSVTLGKETDTDHYFAGRTLDEYLVDINVLKNTCKKKQLMFIAMTEFSEWYYNIDKYNLNKMEQQFSFLNFSIIFTHKNI